MLNFLFKCGESQTIYNGAALGFHSWLQQSCRTLGESFSGREKSKSFVHHESILLHYNQTKTMGIVYVV